MSEPIDNPLVPEFASWKSYRTFEERVTRYRRHVWTQEIQAFLETVKRTLRSREEEIPRGAILWRAQRGVKYIPLKDDTGEEIGEEPIGHPAARMKPIPDKTREGRANSSGIPVLYLASTKDTAISEIRPWIGSEVSVAPFKVTRRLIAIDLTRGHGRSSFGRLTLNQLSDEEEVDAEVKEEAVWTDIDNAFSRPVTRSDESVHYVPTRILAELFQEAGFDAMVYRSQFGPEGKDGYNIAIFDLGDAEILGCAPYRVDSIRVESEQIGNPWSPLKPAPRAKNEP